MAGLEAVGARRKLWTWKFILMMLINFANGMAGYMTVPLVSKYAVSIGANLTVASSISGILPLVAMVVCPVAGVLSDRINRKKLLLATNIGYSVFLCLHAFAGGLGVLAVLRAGTGVFFAVSSVLTVACASSYIPKERMGEGLSYFGLLTPVVQAAGPALGIFLRDSIGYGAAFTGAGAAVLAALAFTAALPYEGKEAGAREPLQLKNIFAWEFVGFMLLTAVFSSANGLISTYLDLLASERGIANIALFFTVYSVVLVLSKPLTGKLLDKKGVYFILLPAVLFASAGMALVGVAMSMGPMLAASVCKALGQGAGSPTIQAHAVKTLESSRGGVAVSTIQIGQSLGNSVAPVAGSVIAASFGYKAMFCGFGAAVLAAGILLLLLQYRKEKRKGIM